MRVVLIILKLKINIPWVYNICVGVLLNFVF